MLLTAVIAFPSCFLIVQEIQETYKLQCYGAKREEKKKGNCNNDVLLRQIIIKFSPHPPPSTPHSLCDIIRRKPIYHQEKQFWKNFPEECMAPYMGPEEKSSVCINKKFL